MREMMADEDLARNGGPMDLDCLVELRTDTRMLYGLTLGCSSGI